jgi:hypothetical protein
LTTLWDETYSGNGTLVVRTQLYKDPSFRVQVHQEQEVQTASAKMVEMETDFQNFVRLKSVSCPSRSCFHTIAIMKRKVSGNNKQKYRCYSRDSIGKVPPSVTLRAAWQPRKGSPNAKPGRNLEP